MEYSKNGKAYIGLWVKPTPFKDSEGNAIYVMKGHMMIDGVKHWIQVEENRNKKADTHPDYNIVCEPVKDNAKSGYKQPQAPRQVEDVPFLPNGEELL